MENVGLLLELGHLVGVVNVNIAMESATENDTPDVVKGLTAIENPREVIYPTVDALAPSKALRIMQVNDQIKELQTIIRDKNTSRSDFVFYADRLIRLVVEEGLNQLSYTECTVITPTGK
ncbi:unnamed protein product [Ixodes hexagonus]